MLFTKLIRAECKIFNWRELGCLENHHSRISFRNAIFDTGSKYAPMTSPQEANNFLRTKRLFFVVIERKKIKIKCRKHSGKNAYLHRREESVVLNHVKGGGRSPTKSKRNLKEGYKTRIVSQTRVILLSSVKLTRLSVKCLAALCCYRFRFEFFPAAV